MTASDHTLKPFRNLLHQRGHPYMHKSFEVRASPFSRQTYPTVAARLSKLEQRQGASKEGSSFIIQRQLFWREEDLLRSVPAYASILTGTVCERVEYSDGETVAAFEARVDAKASGGAER
jgi:hypothetical protein